LVLAQSAPPLVAVPNTPAAPYVVREHGEVCVVEPAPNGGETKSCRKEGAEYNGAAATPPPAVKEDPKAKEEQRPPSQFGFAMKLGAAFPFGEDSSAVQSSTALHGRVGLRYALFDRSKEPGRPNLALAMLGGGDLDGSRGGLGVETRLEGTVGGDNLLLEPLFNVFAAVGVQYLLSSVPELHVGGGLNLDLLCTGILGGMGGLFLSSGSGAAAAVIGFLLAPTVEYRYVMRADGTHYNAVLLAMGM
jgi:hypothetical protein